MMVKEASESVENLSSPHPARLLSPPTSPHPWWEWDEATASHQLSDDAGISPGVLWKGSVG